MENAQNQALLLYESICATSGDRPFSFRNVEDLRRGIAAWRANSPALRQQKQASPEVQSAFLHQSVEWLKAESRGHRNFRVTATLVDAILYALQAARKPLPSETVLRILTELRESELARHYFPVYQFLCILTLSDVTDDIRGQIRRLHLLYAPTPNGRIGERTLQVRNRLAELTYVEGEKKLDAGRGPWSQIVFDEIGAKDDITASAWRGLLDHCATLEQAVPGKTWKKRACDVVHALGEQEVFESILRWLALGPTPGQLPEARSPIEDSPFQKGAVWILALSNRPEAALGIGDFAIECLRKIRMLGAVSQKVGFACLQALGSMECNEAISQLARLRSKIKYVIAQRLIEKCLKQAAERTGLTVDELEDMSVPHCSLNQEGKAEFALGDVLATVQLAGDGQVHVVWRNSDGKLLKSPPSHIKKALPKEVKSVSALSKELERNYSAQCFRLEVSLSHVRTMPTAHWRKYFLDHPLLGFLGRRLIWVFSDGRSWEASGLWRDGEIRAADSQVLNISQATKARLWHPLSSNASDVEQWREAVFSWGVRQPFRQAFREFYELTDDERQTKMYSNRFAGIIMRQHQFSSLCRARGWNYRLMGAGFDGFNVPTKAMDSWDMHAEFYVDLPSDRDPALSESALGEESDAGINRFLTSDQVRFYRARKEISLEDVPAILYSEVMRDVDLFTSVSAVGPDESWSDQGDRGIGLVIRRRDIEETSALAALRLEMLSRALPLTPLAAQCRIDKGWLEVRGQLGTYRIHISWGGVVRFTESGFRHLNIPRKLLEKVPFDGSAFAIDLDYRVEMALRKAYVLADDWKIDSPDLIQQLM